MALSFGLSELSPCGLKDPNKSSRAQNPKNRKSIWALTPFYLGPWALRVRLRHLDKVA